MSILLRSICALAAVSVKVSLLIYKLSNNKISRVASW